MSSKAYTGQPDVSSPVRYFSLGPSPADGGSPAAAVSAVGFIIAEASADELRAVRSKLEQAMQYVYEWGASSYYSEQAAAERPVKLAVVVFEPQKGRNRGTGEALVPSYGPGSFVWPNPTQLHSSAAARAVAV